LVLRFGITYAYRLNRSCPGHQTCGIWMTHLNQSVKRYQTLD
jgi:hypothetical protein